ncbi:MAG: VTT domain-containing protein [Chloroflexota bacterium]
MSEDALRGPHDAPVPEPPMRRIVLDMPSWLPTDKIPQRALIAAGAVFVIAVFVITIIPLVTDWVSEDQFERYGYAGIFLANFMANATAFVPVPGLSAIGQALIIEGSDRLFVPGVVVAGATAMTLAETTAYGIGALGRGIAEEREMPVKGRIGAFMHRAAGWVDWLMAHYGFLTLLVLSAIPNPLFEFAGITAGAVRMNFWRFIVAVGVGKTIRVIILVTVGRALFDALSI